MGLIRRFLVVIFSLSLLLGCSTTNEGYSYGNANTPSSTVTPQNTMKNEPDKIEENSTKKPKLTRKIEVKKDTNKQTAKTPQKQKKKVLLDVPLVKQNPELKYGCEVTSLTMVLQYAGIKVNKMTLANQLPKDVDQIQRSRTGDIVRWGDPNDGFVGDITGNKAGYAVFDRPLENLMRRYLGDRVINLTGSSFNKLLNQISHGKPVVVWTTGDYRLPDRWESWRHGRENINTPLDLHAVVLVGFDENNVYLNDPLSGKKGVKVNKKTFIGSWSALKKRAISYN